MRKISLAVLVIFTLGLLGGVFLESSPVEADSNVKNFSLEEAIRYGMENSPEIKKVELDEDIAEINYKMAHSIADKSEEQREEFGAGSSWDSVNAEVIAPAQAEMAKDIKEKELQYRKDTLRLEIERKYCDVIYFEKKLDNAKATLERAQEELRLAKVKFEVGTVAKLAVQQAEAQFAEKEAAVSDAKRNYEEAVRSFNKLLGLPLDTKIKLESDFTMEKDDNFDLEKVIDRVMEKDLLVYSRRRALDVAEIAFEQADRIFTSNVYTYRQKKLEYEKAKIEKEEEEKGLEMRVMNAYRALETMKEQYEALDKAVAAAKEGYRLTRVRYEVGMATQLELMQSAEQLHQLEANKLSVLYNYNLMLAQFKNYLFPPMGGLDA